MIIKAIWAITMTVYTIWVKYRLDFSIIINCKNKIYKPTLETDIITKKPQFPGKPKVIKTVTNLPNKGSLSLNTNILIEEN